MIAYNPKDWFTFIFRFHKADTFRKLLPLIVFICAYSGLVAYLELEYWKLSDTSYVKNLPIMHNSLGLVISLLLVFRTNTAYDRWWEGRKLWGSLTNNSRNLALKMQAILGSGHEEHRLFYSKIIPLYAWCLRRHLRLETTRLALSDESDEEIRSLDYNKHLPNQVARILYHRTLRLHREGLITSEQLLFINPELTSFTDICGACERIKNTPIPFSYSVFLKKFIFFYVMTLPFGYVFQLGYYVIPIVAFIFYVLASLELIGEEIEDPFTGDANDIPMDIISQNIQTHVSEILHSAS